MPTIFRAGRNLISETLRFPDWNDVIELDSAVAQTYTIPAGVDLLLINPISQTDGSAAPVYGIPGAGTIITTAVGSAFGNQPSNDSVDVVSSDNGDTTQTVTIIGTTNGADTVVTEDIALTGTTPVTSSKVDWGIILAVKLDASCDGTVTVQKTTGPATITTLLTTVTSKGVNSVSSANQSLSDGRLVTLVASEASTKQLGIQGTNSSGTTIYDSQALTGTTALFSNSQFTTVTEVYTGDLAGTTTATLTANVAFIPTADDTTGTASFPITGPYLVQVDRAGTISFIRAGSSTVNVCIAAWTKDWMG